MNDISLNEFMNTDAYKNFISINSGSGSLKIRAYAASEALPVAGLHIVVSSVIDDDNVIFFDGYTDASGMIETITLPAPKLLDNLVVPRTTLYTIVAGDKNIFNINMYDNISVVQNINFVPGEIYGS